MPIEFRYRLDEIVRLDGRDATLRTAIREYSRTRKLMGYGSDPTLMWHREAGEKPSFFEPNHMDLLANSVSGDDLNASNDDK